MKPLPIYNTKLRTFVPNPYKISISKILITKNIIWHFFYNYLIIKILAQNTFAILVLNRIFTSKLITTIPFFLITIPFLNFLLYDLAR